MSCSLKPDLGYEDAPAAIRFLVETLGFTVSVVYEGPDGSVAYAELTWPTGGGVSSSPARERIPLPAYSAAPHVLTPIRPSPSISMSQIRMSCMRGSSRAAQ